MIVRLAFSILFCTCAIRLHAQQAQHSVSLSYGDTVIAKVYLINVSPAASGVSGNYDVKAGFVGEGKFTSSSQATFLTGVNAYVGVQDSSRLIAGFQATRQQTRLTTATTILNVPFVMQNGRRTSSLILNVGGVLKTVEIFGDGMYKITVSLTNNDAVGTEYIVMQGTNELGRVYLRPGESRIATYTTSAPDPATVLNQQFGGYQSDGGWIVQPVGNPAPVGSPITPSPSGTPASPVPIPANPPGAGGTSNGPGQTLGDVIWKEGDGRALDASTFKQGVETIANAIKAAAGTGGGTTDMSGVHTRLDTVNTNLSDIKADGRVSGVIADKVFDTTTDEELSVNKAQAVGVLGLLPDAPTITSPGSFSGVMTLPLAFPGIASQTMTIDLNEFETGIDIFKIIVRGALSLGFFFMAVKTIKQAFA